MTLILLLFILSLFSKKRKHIMFTEQDAKDGLIEVKKIYGEPMAKLIEKMYRLETNHFKSLAYKLTGSAGMEVGAWGKHLIGANISKKTVTLNDADKTDGADKFIVWNSVKDAMFFLADYINRHNGNFAMWNSTKPAQQKIYSASINGVKNKFV